MLARRRAGQGGFSYYFGVIDSCLGILWNDGGELIDNYLRVEDALHFVCGPLEVALDVVDLHDIEEVQWKMCKVASDVSRGSISFHFGPKCGRVFNLIYYL